MRAESPEGGSDGVLRDRDMETTAFEQRVGSGLCERRVGSGLWILDFALEGEAVLIEIPEYASTSSDLALYLRPKCCGLRLKELGERVGGLDYRTVS